MEEIIITEEKKLGRWCIFRVYVVLVVDTFGLNNMNAASLTNSSQTRLQLVSLRKLKTEHAATVYAANMYAANSVIGF